MQTNEEKNLDKRPKSVLKLCKPMTGRNPTYALKRVRGGGMRIANESELWAPEGLGERKRVVEHACLRKRTDCVGSFEWS